MGRRSRKRAQQGGGEPSATSDYTADDGSVLTLRDQLSAGTVRKLADLDAKIQSGALEGSNVDLTQALVDMIENQRAYEVQANLLKEAKDMDQGGASLMRMPG